MLWMNNQGFDAVIDWSCNIYLCHHLHVVKANQFLPFLTSRLCNPNLTWTFYEKYLCYLVLWFIVRYLHIQIFLIYFRENAHLIVLNVTVSCVVKCADIKFIQSEWKRYIPLAHYSDYQKILRKSFNTRQIYGPIFDSLLIGELYQ